MTIAWNVGTSGGIKTTRAATLGTSSGNKSILNAWVGTASGNKQFYASLSATLTGGGTASGTTGSHPFGSIAPVVSGGSGSYTYIWHESDDAQGTWTAPGSTSSQSVSVTGVGGTNSSTTNYYCVVTDTLTSATAATGTVSFTWNNTTGGGL